MKRNFFKFACLMALLLYAVAASAAVDDNDKILNRPYADAKRIHFGFSVGMNFHNLAITNNAFITDDYEQWFADVPNLSPGFSVSVLADLKLMDHLNLRFAPGMQFGNKVVKFTNSLGDPNAAELSHYRQTQNIKSTYVVFPIELKYSALRSHNIRPYVMAGVMGILDVTKERHEQLKLKRTDAMLEIGFGCDFYLPFFKLCPELKFCFGLRNLLDRNRPDLEEDPDMLRFTESVDKIKSNMVVLTFYFE